MASNGNEDWILGVILGLLGSIAINTGNNIQSLGLKRLNERIVPQLQEESKGRKSSSKKRFLPWIRQTAAKTAPQKNFDETESIVTAEKKHNPMTSKTWVLGTFIFVTGSLLNFVSYAFAAQSLLASLESVQFVTNLLFGKFLLGAHVTQTMFAGTCLTVTGTVMAVEFSSKEALDLSLDEMKKLYINPPYLCYMAFTVVLLVALQFIYQKFDKMKKENKPANRSDIIMPCAYSVWSALFGTQSVVQAKVLAELLSLHSSGKENIFNSWFTYVTLILWILTAVVWLKRLNDALDKFNPLFIIPLLQWNFIFFAIVSGGIFFLEFNAFILSQWVGFWFGIIVMFSGLVLLTPQPIHAEDENLHRQIVQLIIENGKHGQDLGRSANALRCSSHTIHVKTNPSTSLGHLNCIENNMSTSGDEEKTHLVVFKPSRETITRAALDVVLDAVNKSANMFNEVPTTKALRVAMISATVNQSDMRRRRKTLEALLQQMKESPISAQGYNTEIMSLINELKLDGMITPCKAGCDVKAHLDNTQESLRKLIVLELEQKSSTGGSQINAKLAQRADELT